MINGILTATLKWGLIVSIVAGLGYLHDIVIPAIIVVWAMLKLDGEI